MPRSQSLSDKSSNIMMKLSCVWKNPADTAHGSRSRARSNAPLVDVWHCFRKLARFFLSLATSGLCVFPSLCVVSCTKMNFQPVVRLEGKLCIFPGIPSLFQKLLDNLKPFLPLPTEDARPFRLQVFTP